MKLLTMECYSFKLMRYMYWRCLAFARKMCNTAQNFYSCYTLEVEDYPANQRKNISKSERENIIVTMYNNFHAIDDI